MENFSIGYEPEINFEDTTINIIPNCRFVLKNGSPNLINKIMAVRQWVTKFCITEKNVNEIYQGTGFGTRFKQLYGRKRIGYGFEEAEIERDFREGLALCPAISEVVSFEIKKNGRILSIKLKIELSSGDLLDIDIEKAYTIK